MIDYYQPDFMVLEDASAVDSRRAPRIRRLVRQIISLAGNCDVKVELVLRKEIGQMLLGKKATKYEIAQMLAECFQQLSHRLPPKRKPWMSEDYRMDIFDAVAFGLAFGLRNKKISAPGSF